MTALESTLVEVLDEVRSLRVEMAQLKERFKPSARVLNLPQAAKALGVGLTKMRELVRDGQVKTVRVGSRPMVPAAELDRLSSGSKKPRQPKPAAQTQDPAALRAALRVRRS